MPPQAGQCKAQDDKDQKQSLMLSISNEFAETDANKQIVNEHFCQFSCI